MDPPRSAPVVVCGAGIIGVSTAYFLSVRLGVPGVVLVDPRWPLTLTSDKSTECYRNWWPNRPMVELMNRSIDVLEELAEESGDAFNLNRNGYLYVTGDESHLARLQSEGATTSKLGAGELRRHQFAETYGAARSGADLLVGAALAEQFPYLAHDAIGALHVRRGGWLSAQQLGAWMLSQAVEHGLTFLRRTVIAVAKDGGEVAGVAFDDGTELATPVLVNAAGPMLADVGRLVGVELPVHSETHLKVAFRDPEGAFPRDTPLLIWTDPQEIHWSDEERRHLIDAGRDDLLGTMPGACHGRPEGGEESPWVLALWEYQRDVRVPEWPIPQDPLYAETVIRGMATMIPTLSVYRDRLPETRVDGGYYTKTVENRPLIGPMGVPGSFVAGAVSGYGIMVAAAVGELAALHATGGNLPDHADDFLLQRYEDPAYLEEIASTPDTGQL